MSGARALARTAFEQALMPLAGAARRGRARRGDVAIVSYHNITPDGVPPRGDASLHLAVGAFVQQIERLAGTHKIVPLAELVTDAGAGDRVPLAAITFDDAYRGALALGLPALAERALPATVFVPPGLLGQETFWWDELASDNRTGLAPGVRDRVLRAERGRHPAASASRGLRADQGPADLEALAQAAALPGVSFASHSWSHANLTALDAAELEVELARPRAWLRERFPDRACADHISFPYGLWDERVAEAARTAGYRFLYRVEGGLARPSAARVAPLPRINVPAGVSARGFELRVAGLVPS